MIAPRMVEEELRALLREGMGRARREGEFLRLLAWHLGRHPGLSPRNRLLVALQRPLSRRVRSEAGWKEEGHRLRPTAQGATILAPARWGGFVPYRVYGDEEVEPKPLLRFLGKEVLRRLKALGLLRKGDLEDPQLGLLRGLTRGILREAQGTPPVALAAWAAEGLAGLEGRLDLGLLPPEDPYPLLVGVGVGVEKLAQELGLLTYAMT